jgi:hypothetical protein
MYKYLQSSSPPSFYCSRGMESEFPILILNPKNYKLPVFVPCMGSWLTDLMINQQSERQAVMKETCMYGWNRMEESQK